MVSRWTKLTRADLKTFDTRSTDLILRAMALPGVEGRLTSKSHCILRSPSGETMSISRKMNMQNRSSQNIEAGWNRLFSALENEVAAQAPERPAQPAAPPEFTANRERVVSKCPVPGCKQQFPTMGGLYSHTRRDHAVCLECEPPEVLAGEVELIMHKEKEHPPTENGAEATKQEDPPFKCPECGKEYDVRRFLGAHRWKAHKVEGESQRARQRSQKRAAAPHAPSDVQCDVCHTWHKDNRLLGLHKRVKHGIPGGTHPSRQHKTPPTTAQTNHPAGQRAHEAKQAEWVVADETDKVPPASVEAETFESEARAAEVHDTERIIEEIVAAIPERFLAANSAEVSRLRSVVEGLQEQLGTVTRERDDLKARLDLLREAMGA